MTTHAYVFFMHGPPTRPLFMEHDSYRIDDTYIKHASRSLPSTIAACGKMIKYSQPHSVYDVRLRCWPERFRSGCLWGWRSKIGRRRVTFTPPVKCEACVKAIEDLVHDVPRHKLLIESYINWELARRGPAHTARGKVVVGRRSTRRGYDRGDGR